MISQEIALFREQMAATWSAYLTRRDRGARDSLIESYLFLVKGAARRAHARLAGRVTVDDLESAGTLGLMDAVDSFDPARGIAFETFSVHRIRGAMLDEVRALDWVPRSVRIAERKLLAGRAALAQALGRVATNAEVAEHLRLPLDAVLKMDRDCRATQVVPLSALTGACGDDESGRDREAVLERCKVVPDPAARECHDEVCHAFVQKLSRTERLIVNLYYVEGLTFREVGRSLGLSEGRISQIHARALARLRELAGVPSPPSRKDVDAPPHPLAA